MAWSDLSTTKLIWVARRQKDHIRNILGAEMAEPGSQLEARGKDGAPGITFIIATRVLSQVQIELATRGIMPDDPKLGGKENDLLPMIAEVMANAG